jgi:uncharacterized repeat protein (TIGR02543 family)
LPEIYPKPSAMTDWSTPAIQVNSRSSRAVIPGTKRRPTRRAAAGDNGSITGSGEYDPGTPATLTATPNPGYRFTGWTGDASGTENPLTITMDADKTVGATFEKDLTDADADGLSAYDELVVHGTNPALADTDGDGLSDGYELGIGRFSIVTGSFTWQQARTDARSKGGDLASFPTEDRWNRAMQNLGVNPFEEFTGLWIGASDAAVDGTWTWVNGEAFSFAPGAPAARVRPAATASTSPRSAAAAVRRSASGMTARRPRSATATCWKPATRPARPWRMPMATA